MQKKQVKQLVKMLKSNLERNFFSNVENKIKT